MFVSVRQHLVGTAIQFQKIGTGYLLPLSPPYTQPPPTELLVPVGVYELGLLVPDRPHVTLPWCDCTPTIPVLPPEAVEYELYPAELHELPELPEFLIK
ncbi:unnamed protein product [Didymodactylos carnosus]|uniref:Uncharacterized protein n=1 Tax=Didymodactylos carnosus TaxID=1234261 RepID=A0A816CV34_9BILA|nr:unnamed protein product [Didymodactylos carnosus]CAF4521132.1 unnamed protein product [Didymodactylos carnosus]